MSKRDKDKSVEYKTAENNASRAIEAYYGNGRKAAIELMCFDCMGGHGEVGYKKDASNCKAHSCPLWRFRPGAKNTKIPEGTVPPKEKLAKKLASDGRGAHLNGLKNKLDKLNEQ